MKGYLLYKAKANDFGSPLDKKNLPPKNTLANKNYLPLFYNMQLPILWDMFDNIFIAVYN